MSEHEVGGQLSVSIHPIGGAMARYSAVQFVTHLVIFGFIFLGLLLGYFIGVVVISVVLPFLPFLANFDEARPYVELASKIPVVVSSDTWLSATEPYLWLAVGVSGMTALIATAVVVWWKLEIAMFELMGLLVVGILILRMLPSLTGWGFVSESFYLRYMINAAIALTFAVIAFATFHLLYRRIRVAKWHWRYTVANLIVVGVAFGLFTLTGRWAVRPELVQEEIEVSGDESRFASVEVLSSDQLRIARLMELQQLQQDVKSMPEPPGESYAGIRLTHTVKPGDSYWAIAGRLFGEPERWSEVFGPRPARLEVGDVLEVPLRFNRLLQYKDALIDEWILPGMPVAIAVDGRLVYVLVSNTYPTTFELDQTGENYAPLTRSRASLLIFLKGEDRRLSLISSTEIEEDLDPWIELGAWQLRLGKFSEGCQILYATGEFLPLKVLKICFAGDGMVTQTGPTHNKNDFRFIDVVEPAEYEYPALLGLTSMGDGNNILVLHDITDVTALGEVDRERGRFRRFVERDFKFTPAAAGEYSVLGDGGLWGVVKVIIGRAGLESKAGEVSATPAPGVSEVNISDARNLSESYQALGVTSMGGYRYIAYCLGSNRAEAGAFVIEKQEIFDTVLPPAITKVGKKFELLSLPDDLECSELNLTTGIELSVSQTADGSSQVTIFRDRFIEWLIEEEGSLSRQSSLLIDGLIGSKTVIDDGLVYKIGYRESGPVHEYNGRLIVMELPE